MGQACCELAQRARDAAAAAMYYGSDQAGSIIGATLLVDGGLTAGYPQRERSPQATP